MRKKYSEIIVRNFAIKRWKDRESCWENRKQGLDGFSKINFWINVSTWVDIKQNQGEEYSKSKWFNRWAGIEWRKHRKSVFWVKLRYPRGFKERWGKQNWKFPTTADSNLENYWSLPKWRYLLQIQMRNVWV